MSQKPIPGGYILLSRKLLKSGIMEKPPLYTKLWIWMLMQASYKDHGNLKRGQFFTSLEGMRGAMTHKVGYREVRPTIKEIRGVTKFLTKARMMVTTKVTHGMIITILNYDHYQNAKNYEGHNEGQSEGHIEGTILTRKDKERKNPDFLNLRKRYPNQDLIDKVFQAIASTRRHGRVAESILYSQLQKWDKHPVAQVESGIRVYLEKDCAGQGKDEKYLWGIIQKQKSFNNNQPTAEPPPVLTIEEIEEMNREN
jgi:hypothetical protein